MVDRPDTAVAEQRPSNDSGRSRPGSAGCVFGAIAGFVILIVFSPAWMPPVRFLFQFLGSLLTGWLRFSIRWQMTDGNIGWGDAAPLAVLFLVVTFVGHSVACWMARRRRFDRWNTAATVKSIGVVLSALLAGIALLGITRQVFWIRTSNSRMTDAAVEGIRARMHSGNYLRGIALTLDEYERLHRHYPPGGTFDDDGRPMHSWVTFLLPYWSEDTGRLHDEIDPNLPWDSDANRPAMQKRVMLLNVRSQGRSHTSDGYATSRFAAVSHALPRNRAMRTADVSDGLANTLFLGDVRFRHKAWGDPTNVRDLTLGINQRADGFGSSFAGGASFLAGDGSVRILSNNTAPEVLEALATPDGGEPLNTRERPYRLRAAPLE